MEHQDILDHNITPPPFDPNQQDRRLYPEDYTASSGLRFANYLIDSLVMGIAHEVLNLTLGISQFSDIYSDGTGPLEIVLLRLLLGIITTMLYMGIMEGTTGRTLGKMITGTIVVNRDGDRISWGQAFGRSACRYIPFDALSFLGSRAIGWHDSIPGTFVVNRRYAEIRAQEGNPILY